MLSFLIVSTSNNLVLLFHLQNTSELLISDVKTIGQKSNFLNREQAFKMIYKCTVEVSCTKTFEKYVDWCSHELLAHKNNLDVWVCNGHPTDPVGNCNIAFRHELDFTEHRFMKHNDPNVTAAIMPWVPRLAATTVDFVNRLKHSIQPRRIKL